MRNAFVVAVIFLWGQVASAQDAPSARWSFEDVKPGALPAGWTADKTGEGEGSVWKISEDKSAPSGKNVLAQTAAGPRPLFNLCVIDKSSFQDLELSVACKAVEGKIDQGGGLVWRYRDPNNYYIARFNPLEKNFRLYRVVNGKRELLATKEDLNAPAGEWHTLAVTMNGNAIECLLNGIKHLETKDDTFSGGGKVGLWTKADAQTYFDALQVKGIK